MQQPKCYEGDEHKELERWWLALRDLTHKLFTEFRHNLVEFRFRFNENKLEQLVYAFTLSNTYADQDDCTKVAVDHVRRFTRELWRFWNFTFTLGDEYVDEIVLRPFGNRVYRAGIVLITSLPGQPDLTHEAVFYFASV